MERPAVPHPSLRFLRIVGIAAPVLFIVGLQLLRPLIDERWSHPGDVIVTTLTVVAALGFGLAMFLLIDRVYQSSRQSALAEERHRATLTERDRIAREMHDSLAQVVGATHLRLQALLSRTDLPADITEELAHLAESCGETYRDVREAILGLREGTRSDRTLLESLDRYVSAYGRRNAIEADFIAEASPGLALAPALEVQVLRIIQEALANARKHSGAQRVRVHVAATDHGVTFTVTDDGRGFDPQELTEGYGLHVMRERAESVAGVLRIDSAPGRGTSVAVAIPALAEAAA